jgi:hypothetical protein
LQQKRVLNKQAAAYAGQPPHHYLSRFHNSLPHLGPRPLLLAQCCPANWPCSRMLHLQLSTAQLRQQCSVLVTQQRLACNATLLLLCFALLLLLLCCVQMRVVKLVVCLTPPGNPCLATTSFL